LFRQYLVLALVNQMASALFRLIAAVGREMTVALTLGSFTLAILFAMSGFVLSKGITDTELNIPRLCPFMFYTNIAPLFPLFPQRI